MASLRTCRKLWRQRTQWPSSPDCVRQTMKIEAATLDDLPVLMRIGADFYKYNPMRETCELDRDSLAATLEELIAKHIVLILSVGGKKAGAAGAFIAPLYWNFSQLQALEFFLWIDPIYRGNGTGAALHNALEEEAKERGVKYFHMGALEDSNPEKTGQLYEKAGYHKIESMYMKVLT